jgi:hypothetical protein
MSESRTEDELRARIAELRAARAQFSPLSRPMISTAYIDESGTHDGSPMTVMAGYLSSAEGWAAFNAEWGLSLRALASTTFTPNIYSMGKSPSKIFHGHDAPRLPTKLRQSL